MRFALVGDELSRPLPGLHGRCPNCGYEVVSKCGSYVRWHWAHKARTMCDPWHESETEWHLNWKDAFPEECQEVIYYDESTGERHIADVSTPNNFVMGVRQIS